MSLREELLDAATDLLTDHGYTRLRMADVAARAGVSRQTVYNEFGGKYALAQAVALRTLAEFTDGIHHRLTSAPDAIAGLRAATAYTIEHAKENRLVAAVTGTDAATDLLPLLTTRGGPILRAATDMAESYLREQCRELADPRFVAETTARLTLSYLVLPTASATEAADGVCAVLGPLIDASTAKRGEGNRP